MSLYEMVREVPDTDLVEQCLFPETRSKITVGLVKVGIRSGPWQSCPRFRGQPLAEVQQSSVPATMLRPAWVAGDSVSAPEDRDEAHQHSSLTVEGLSPCKRQCEAACSCLPRSLMKAWWASLARMVAPLNGSG